MRFLVCGGRDFGLENDEYNYIFKTLSNIITYEKHDYIVVMHGGARGADESAGDFCTLMGIPCVVFDAEWKKYGKAAGFIRNKKMLDEGKPDWVIAFPGGKGTKMMVDIAEKSGVKVFQPEYPFSDFFYLQNN